MSCENQLIHLKTDFDVFEGVIDQASFFQLIDELSDLFDSNLCLVNS